MKMYIASNSHAMIMTNDLSNRHTNREPTLHTQNSTEPDAHLSPNKRRKGKKMIIIITIQG